MNLARMLCFLGTILTPFLAAADSLDQWMTRTSPVPVSLNDIIYANGLFVAVGSGDKLGEPRLIVSSNGVDWIRFASAARFTPTAITYGSNGLFVAVGRTDIYDGAAIPGVTVSTNGTNWSFIPTFGNAFVKTNFQAVTCGNGLFMAVGLNGIVAVSTNGTDWDTFITPTPYQLTGVAYGNGLWVAVGPREPPGGPSLGSDGPLLTSTDGTNWVEQDSSFNAVRVFFARGMFIAIAGDTFQPNLLPMRYSFDGTNWMNISEPAIHVMRGITCGGGGIFVAAGKGLIKASLDGSNWVRRISADTNRLTSVAYGNHTFVAVGDVILQSEDIRPRVRIAYESNPSSPHFHIYVRGISNATYGLQLSGNFTNWQTRVTGVTTGGEDDFYRFSPALKTFYRLRQMP